MNRTYEQLKRDLYEASLKSDKDLEEVLYSMSDEEFETYLGPLLDSDEEFENTEFEDPDEFAVNADFNPE